MLLFIRGCPSRRNPPENMNPLSTHATLPPGNKFSILRTTKSVNRTWGGPLLLGQAGQSAEARCATALAGLSLPTHWSQQCTTFHGRSTLSLMSSTSSAGGVACVRRHPLPALHPGLALTMRAWEMACSAQLGLQTGVPL